VKIVDDSCFFAYDFRNCSENASDDRLRIHWPAQRRSERQRKQLILCEAPVDSLSCGVHGLLSPFFVIAEIIDVIRLGLQTTAFHFNFAAAGNIADNRIFRNGNGRTARMRKARAV